MSDPPTQRLPPLPPEPHRRERVVELPPEPLAAHVAHDVSSLRWWLALVSVLGLVALGVALYALLRADDADRRSADPSRVAELDSRVDGLERAVRDAGRASDITRLRRELRDKAAAEDLDRLARTTTQLQEQVAELRGEDGAGVDQRLDAIETRVDELARQVQESGGASP